MPRGQRTPGLSSGQGAPGSRRGLLFREQGCAPAVRAESERSALDRGRSRWGVPLEPLLGRSSYEAGPKLTAIICRAMTTTRNRAQVVAHKIHGGAPSAGGARGAEQRVVRARTRVTIAQIAQESGLSTATISKVLNGKPDVAASTRKLVEELLFSSGYRKPGRGDAPALIDVVFNDFDSPWAIEIVRGAAAAAQAEGLTVALTA